jgi:hypothetical protein
MPFARDAASGIAYDGPVAQFFGRMLAPLDSIPAGGAFFPPTLVWSDSLDGDGMPGSDLTAQERAWQRAMYHYVDVNAPRIRYADRSGRSRSRPAVSMRIRWGRRMWWAPDGAWRRTVTVALFANEGASRPLLGGYLGTDTARHVIAGLGATCGCPPCTLLRWPLTGLSGDARRLCTRRPGAPPGLVSGCLAGAALSGGLL